jgi:hypothetical protein
MVLQWYDYMFLGTCVPRHSTGHTGHANMCLDMDIVSGIVSLAMMHLSMYMLDMDMASLPGRGKYTPGHGKPVPKPSVII